jgi:hypothetical protein
LQKLPSSEADFLSRFLRSLQVYAQLQNLNPEMEVAGELKQISIQYTGLCVLQEM